MKAKTREQRFRELQAAVDKDLYACIIELAQDYLRDFPKHGVVWLDYGDALLSFGRYKEARLALSRAIKYMRPEDLDLPYSYMGHIHKSRGDYRRAAEWYQKAVNAAPGEARNLIYLGSVLIKAGKFTEAEGCFRKAVKCKEGPVDEAYYNLGVTLCGQAKYKAALVCFEKALRLDPTYKLAKRAIRDMEGVLSLKGTSNNGMHPTPRQRASHAR
jgi:tetratricopeptide (TPR) repeat protein